MRIPGIKTIKRAGQWIHSRFNGHALILGYHRVADKQDDLYGICVTQDHFQEQMEVLQRCAHVVRLQDLIEGMKTGYLPDRSVVITFDDGYSDLLYTVKPVLELYQVPCTAFVVTGCLGQEFWWDELERLISRGSLETGGSTLSVYQKLLPLSLADRQQEMSKLRGQAATLSIESDRSRALSLDELVEFASGELIEIGSHGVSHNSLGQLAAKEQKFELLESKAFLEKQLGKTIYSFSYPNGSYSTTSGKLASESGYGCACRSSPGAVFFDSDRYQLPRFWIPDWDGSTFQRWLLRWV